MSLVEKLRKIDVYYADMADGEKYYVHLKDRPQVLRQILEVMAEEMEKRVCPLCRAILKESGHFYADAYFDRHEIGECGTLHRFAQGLRAEAEKIK